MKKSYLNYVVGGALFLSAPMLTSCQDILGEWDKPTPANTDAGGGGSTEGVAYKSWVSGSTFDDKTATTYTKVTSSTTTWSEGTYVVDDDITIAGGVSVTGDVNLILCDGKKLTVNGNIADGSATPTYSLSIYAQSEGTGELEVNTTANEYSFRFKGLSINGGTVTASNTEGTVGQVLFVSDNLNIYGGKVNATSTSGVAIMLDEAALKIYNASVTANGATGISNWGTGGINSIYSGSVTATGTTAGIATGFNFYGGSITATGTTEGMTGTVYNASENTITYDTYDGTNWTTNVGTNAAGTLLDVDALDVKGVKIY